MTDNDIAGWVTVLHAELADLNASGKRIATALESLAETQRLSLKLAAGVAGTTVTEVRAALHAESDDVEAEGRREGGGAASSNSSSSSSAPRQPRSGADLMQLLAQDPEELDMLHRTHAHAEREYGRGQVPADLDLYAYAAEAGIDQDSRPAIEEPVSTVPLPPTVE